MPDTLGMRLRDVWLKSRFVRLCVRMLIRLFVCNHTKCRYKLFTCCLIRWILHVTEEEEEEKNLYVQHFVLCVYVCARKREKMFYVFIILDIIAQAICEQWTKYIYVRCLTYVLCARGVFQTTIYDVVWFMMNMCTLGLAISRYSRRHSIRSNMNKMHKLINQQHECVYSFVLIFFFIIQLIWRRCLENWAKSEHNILFCYDIHPPRFQRKYKQVHILIIKYLRLSILFSLGMVQ